jgi:hypothetical protein
VRREQGIELEYEVELWRANSEPQTNTDDTDQKENGSERGDESISETDQRREEER